MDAFHHAAKLFSVWGTREVTNRIRWTRCVISLACLAPLSVRPPGFMSFNQAAICDVCQSSLRLGVHKEGEQCNALHQLVCNHQALHTI